MLLTGKVFNFVAIVGTLGLIGMLIKNGIVLTFDPCYMGESAGEPRHVSSPDLFSENVSAGVDYLGLLPYVDRPR